MICQCCGQRAAVSIVTSCNGTECYELHLCPECREAGRRLPTAEQQQRIVASAMDGAAQEGWSEEEVAAAVGVDVEELRRILRGEGVSELAAWTQLSGRLRMERDDESAG